MIKQYKNTLAIDFKISIQGKNWNVSFIVEFHT